MEAIMYFGIGFLVAALSVLVVVPLVHGRAVRLTKRRLEGVMPSSMAEILADKDLLRAEFAMSTRRLENVEQLKAKSAFQLAELGIKGDEIYQLKIELGALRDQLRATEKSMVKATTMHKAERALSYKGSELAKLKGEFDERSVADAQKNEIIALNTEVEEFKEGLDAARHELRAMEDCRDAERIELKASTQRLMAERREAERALSERESELARLIGELNERSALADTQKNEIIALNTEVESLKEGLDAARTATQNLLKAEREKLQAALELEHRPRRRMKVPPNRARKRR